MPTCDFIAHEVVVFTGEIFTFHCECAVIKTKPLKTEQ